MQSSFDKTPFVIGMLDTNGRVRHITGDVADLLGYEPSRMRRDGTTLPSSSRSSAFTTRPSWW